MTDRPKRRLGRVIGLLVVAFVLAVPLALWLLRSTIATSVARRELVSSGVECDERFAIGLSAFFGSATIEPTRCTRAGDGVVEAIELVQPATVELAGLSPEHIEAPHLRLILRPRPLANDTAWARALERLRLEQQAAALVKGLSEVSALGLPSSSFARVDVVRGGDSMAQIDALELGANAPMPLAIGRVVFDAAGVAQLTLERVTGTASRPAVHLEGNASARAGIAIFAIERGGRFELDASGLDGPSPQFALRGDF